MTGAITAIIGHVSEAKNWRPPSLVPLAWKGIAELGHVEDGHRAVSWPQRVLTVEVLGHRARHHHRNRRSGRHGALSGFCGLWSRPAQHSLLVVAGKMPCRNMLCPRAQHNPGSRATVASTASPCLAGGYRFGLYARGKGSENRVVRERPPRIRPWPAQGGLRRRSLPGFFLAGRLGIQVA